MDAPGSPGLPRFFGDDSGESAVFDFSAAQHGSGNGGYQSYNTYPDPDTSLLPWGDFPTMPSSTHHFHADNQSGSMASLTPLSNAGSNIFSFSSDVDLSTLDYEGSPSVSPAGLMPITPPSFHNLGCHEQNGMATGLILTALPEDSGSNLSSDVDLSTLDYEGSPSVSPARLMPIALPSFHNLGCHGQNGTAADPILAVQPEDPGSSEVARSEFSQTKNCKTPRPNKKSPVISSPTAIICQEDGCGTRVADMRALFRHSLEKHTNVRYHCRCGMAQSRKENHIRHLNQSCKSQEIDFYLCRCGIPNLDIEEHLEHIRLCRYGKQSVGRPRGSGRKKV